MIEREPSPQPDLSLPPPLLPPQPSCPGSGWRPEAGPESELPGFYRLPLERRQRLVARMAGLSERDLRVLSGEEGLTAQQAEHMVENVLGVIGLPLGICVNLRVDGRDHLVPMAIEEASVIAAASHAAKLLRAGGGVRSEVSSPQMIGQVQLLDVPDIEGARRALLGARAQLLAEASACDPCLVRSGGGAVDLKVRTLPPAGRDDPLGPMVVVHLVVDVRDAMGANTVNTMCERLAPRIAVLTGGRVRLRIVSNLADRRLVKASGQVPLSALVGKGAGGPEDLARGIVEASVMAERDPYRAATHNKGIMNGVDAVLVAFGQDWRAVEAGAHAFAARAGRYGALSRWRLEGEHLCGELELPLAVGTVGGATWVHPTSSLARQVARVASARDLARLAAAVGLAQNLGALRALAAEGIQQGHMRVHARNLAVAAGAVGSEVERVARQVAHHRQVGLEAAQEALRQVRVCAAMPPDPDQVKVRFKALRERYLPAITGLLDEVLQEADLQSSSLRQMCAYHMDTGGKRLRALLPLLLAEVLGADPGTLVPFGAACEMLHNATLVHDDLQDGDHLRRGRETVWHRFGPGQAINLGDAMFYLTLLLIQRLGGSARSREAVARQVLLQTLRVIDGQQREFLLKGLDRPILQDYVTMVEGKTSGLFALPMGGGALLCGAGPEVVARLQDAARHMGVLFQIQDDLLDLYGEKGREKPGSDIREGKRSILVVHALQAAPPAEARWLQEVLDQDREATTGEQVEQVRALLERSGSRSFALEEIQRRRGEATRIFAGEDQPGLLALVQGMCDLFVEPIAPLLAGGKNGGGR